MFGILPWLSVESSNRAFVLGVLTTAALAGAYIFWGPNSTGRRRTHKGKAKSGQIPGLLNLGKSCFINAVLQSMASSSMIVNWVGALNAKLGQAQPCENKITILSALDNILKVLNGQDPNCENDTANADEVLNALRRNHWVISDDEQDAHEMFHVLTTTIEDELQKEVAVPSLADVARLDDDRQLNTTRCSSKCCNNLPTLRRVTMQRSIPYRGLLASQLRCKTCSNNPELTLRDCLRHFMMPEQVKDVECEKCGSRQVSGEENDADRTIARSTSVKRLTIGKLPDVLCIHIQRMTWLNNGMPMKHYRHITFSEYLDMSEFVYSHRSGNSSAKGSTSLSSSLLGGSAMSNGKPLSNGNATIPISPIKPTISPLGLNNGHSTDSPMVKTPSSSGCNLFRLQAVIVHLGDVHSGHFLTYRRGALRSPYRRRWFLCSDTTVKEVPAKEVFTCNAYMLIFERISSGIHRISI